MNAPLPGNSVVWCHLGTGRGRQGAHVVGVLRAGRKQIVRSRHEVLVCVCDLLLPLVEDHPQIGKLRVGAEDGERDVLWGGGRIDRVGRVGKAQVESRANKREGMGWFSRVSLQQQKTEVGLAKTWKHILDDPS